MLQAGSRIGKYTIESILGRGGNGIVYEVSCGDSRFAMKILHKKGTDTLARFHDEIEVLRMESENKGILPILDSSISNDIAKCWYVMPIAEPILKHIDLAKPEIAIRYVQNACKTMIELHKRGIYHRDIKPSNLYIYNNTCVLSDFGLVAYPKKAHITQSNRKLGPFSTIAPEMRRNPNKAKPGKADSYSLVKTLWILLTGQELGFDGHYNRDDQAVNIEGIRELKFYSVLHSLLENGTENDPEKRYSLDDVLRCLNDQLNMNFLEICEIEWNDVMKRLFNDHEPSYAVWENPSDICRTINEIARYRQINHLFFPGGGGHDVDGGAIVAKDGLIEVLFGMSVYTFKPDRLIYGNVNYNRQLNFFWIDCGEVQPLFPGEHRRFIEDIREYSGRGEVFCEPIGRSDDEEYPWARKRNVHRILKGKLLIASKAGFWNAIPDSYDGKHNTLTWESFREIMLGVDEKMKEKTTIH